MINILFAMFFYFVYLLNCTRVFCFLKKPKNKAEIHYFCVDFSTDKVHCLYQIATYQISLQIHIFMIKILFASYVILLYLGTSKPVGVVL